MHHVDVIVTQTIVPVNDGTRGYNLVTLIIRHLMHLTLGPFSVCLVFEIMAVVMNLKLTIRVTMLEPRNGRENLFRILKQT